MSTTCDTPGRRAIPRRTSTASANCGSSLGFENDVTSSFLKPAPVMRSIISIFRSVGTTFGIDWRPSRAQHSQTTTDSGRETRGLACVTWPPGGGLARGREVPGDVAGRRRARAVDEIGVDSERDRGGLGGGGEQEREPVGALPRGEDELLGICGAEGAAARRRRPAPRRAARRRG